MDDKNDRGMKRAASLFGAVFWKAMAKAVPPETEEQRLALDKHVAKLVKGAVGKPEDTDALWAEIERDKRRRTN